MKGYGTMGFKRLFFVIVCFFVFVLTGREYFMAPDGKSSGSGTPTEPWNSLSTALPKLRPGDTLTLKSGVYYGGGMLKQEFFTPGAAPLTVRAEIPGTVLIRGDEDVSGFLREPGRRFVYSRIWKKRVNAVNEKDSSLVYRCAGNAAELEFLRGAFFYDAGKQKLFVVTSDGKSPGEHRLSVSTAGPVGIGIHYRKDRKFSSAIHISGLNFTGFNAQSYPRTGGVYLHRTSGAKVTDCLFFLNGNGVILRQGQKCEIARCTAYGNDSPLPVGTEGGNIIIFGPADDSVIRECTAFNTSKHGIRFYLGPAKNCLIENCLTFGNRGGGIWIKPHSAENQTRNCTALDGLNSLKSSGDRAVSNAYIKYQKKGDSTDFVFLSEKNKKLFAAPELLDYRVLKGNLNVRYISPGGDDRNRGTTPEQPWKSLKKVEAGQTVYLLPGVYGQLLELKQDNCTVRPYSTKAPVLLAGVKVTGKNALIQDVCFPRSDKWAIESEAAGTVIERCSFGTMPLGIKNDFPVTVRHNTFSASVKDILAPRGAGSVVHSNIFASQRLPEKCAFRDFNSYTANVPLREKNSFLLHPRFKAPHKGDFSLVNEKEFRGRGIEGFPVGAYRFVKKQSSFSTPPELFYVSDTTAELEWWCSSVPKSVRIYWRKNNETLWKQERAYQENFFGTFSLTGLEKNTAYAVAAELEMPTDMVPGNVYSNAKKSPRKTVVFKTRPCPEQGKVFFVSGTRGDDTASGSKKTPWKTVLRGITALRPGDTLLIDDGVYQESCFIRSSGTREKPVTIKAAPGAKVFWDGNQKRLTRALQLYNKSYINIEGLNFRQFGGFSDGVIRIAGGRGISVSRSFCDGRGVGYSPFFIYALRSENCKVSNCVVIRSAHGVYFGSCGGLEIANCVFFLNLIDQIYIDNRPAEKLKVHHCIFVGPSMMKVRNAQLSVQRPELMTEYGNAGYFRLPRQLQFFTGARTKELTLGQYEALMKKKSDFRYGKISFPVLEELTEFKDLKEWQKKWQQAVKLKENAEFGIGCDGTAATWDFKSFIPRKLIYAPDGGIIGLQPERFK